MDIQLLMKTAMLAGTLMLRSGAETYRVEDTMQHILKTAENMEYVQVLVVMTGITASLKVMGEKAVTVVSRVEGRGTNMNCIVEANSISRRYCGGGISLEEAYQELQSIKRHKYSRFQYNLAVVGICVGFSLFFGGTTWDVAASFLVGMFLAFCVFISKILKFDSFIQVVFSSIGIAFACVILKKVFQNQMDIYIVLISCIMPLVPGVAITNAVRDTLRGDYLSGAARILEAFLTATGIALGIGIEIAMFSGIVWKGGF